MNDQARYLQLAQKCREEAAEMFSEEARLHMLIAAAIWENCAKGQQSVAIGFIQWAALLHKRP